MAFLTTPQLARPADETLARTAQTNGQRTYQTGQNALNAPLCDEHGHLLVRTVGAAGYDEPLQSAFAGTPVTAFRGSALNVNDDGLVENQLVMGRASAVNGPGYPKLIRAFGYTSDVGFVQFHLRDESGGVNPPILGDKPEVTIAVGVNTNWVISDYLLFQSGAGGVNIDLATYITFSTTGPTFTPGGVELWFYFFGSR